MIKIFMNYNLIIKSINDISLLFIKRIFPPLFIFFMLSNILKNYSFITLICNTFGIITGKLFKISKPSSYVFFMSILSGFPSSAKYVKEMIESKEISEKEGEKLILFCHFANPLFVLSLIKEKVYLILFCHYIANIIIGILFRNYNGNFYQNKNNIITKQIPFIELITSSIKNITDILINIFGLLVIFYLMSNLININIIKYLLEMTNSINYINNLNVSLKIKSILITGILSFGGICIHMQVMDILYKTKIRFLPYFIARIIHFFISVILIVLLY